MGLTDFYNSKIKLLIDTKGYMCQGVYKPGTMHKLKTIACDVQPVDKELFRQEYGYFCESEYKVYCDPDIDLKINGHVVYENEEYIIEKIQKWSTYYILYIRSVEC